MQDSQKRARDFTKEFFEKVLEIVTRPTSEQLESGSEGRKTSDPEVVR